MRTLLYASVLPLVTCSLAFAEEVGSVPEHVIQDTKYLSGEWTAEVKLAGENRQVTMTVEPMPGNIGYIIRWRGPGGPGKEDVELTAVGGWDASSGQYVETGFSTNGDYFSFRYKLLDATLPPAAQRFKAEGSGVYMGKPMTETISVERQGEDRFIWKATDIKVGGKAIPDEVYHFTRSKDATGTWLAFFAGEWSRETKIWTKATDWKTTTAKWTGKLTSGGNTLFSQGNDSDGVEWTAMDSHYGNGMIEQGSASDSSVWKITWEKIGDKHLHGTLAGYTADGKGGKGNISIERVGKGYVTNWDLKLADGTTMKGIETNVRR